MTEKSQIQKFRETARKIETDKSERHFDEALRKVAKPRSEIFAKASEGQIEELAADRSNTPNSRCVKQVEIH